MFFVLGHSNLIALELNCCAFLFNIDGPSKGAYAGELFQLVLSGDRVSPRSHGALSPVLINALIENQVCSICQPSLHFPPELLSRCLFIDNTINKALVNSLI
jgi:hypothetical protein